MRMGRGSPQEKSNGGSSSKVGMESNGSKAGGPTRKKMIMNGNYWKGSQKNEDHSTNGTSSKVTNCRNSKNELLEGHQNKNGARSATRRNTGKDAPPGKGTDGSGSKFGKHASGRNGAVSAENKQSANGSRGTKSQKTESRSTKGTKLTAPDRGNAKSEPSPGRKNRNGSKHGLKRNNAKGTSTPQGNYTGESSSEVKVCSAANTLSNYQDQPSVQDRSRKQKRATESIDEMGSRFSRVVADDASVQSRTSKSSRKKETNDGDMKPPTVAK